MDSRDQTRRSTGPMRHRRNMYTEDAIAKRTIVIIAVSVVLIIAAAVVVLFMNTTPAKVPNMTATVEAAGNVVYLYHDGGDPFPKNNLLIRVNGEDIPTDSYTLLHSQDWPWSAGKTVKVQYNGAGNPESVQVVYVNGNKQTVVFSQQIQPPATIPIATVISVSPTTVPVTIIPATSTGSTVTIPVVTMPIVTVPLGTPVVPIVLPSVTPLPAVTSAPPAADFIAQPLSGANPLIVHFTDQSSGVPVSWIWDFGDGATSSDQNPVHTYSTPGTFTVSLTVSNNFGSNKKTRNAMISSGIAPVAAFTASPRSGTAPLEVHFTDISTGQPAAWSWDFGDGTTSTLQNPAHVYSDGGSYTVSLAVANLFGADSRVQSGYISAATSPTHDVYLTGSAYGYLQPDGYIAFRVTTPDSWIKIGGKQWKFNPSDSVQLIIGDPGSGFIDAAGGQITAFNFNTVDMYVNNTLASTGIVSDIDITGYTDYRSSTTLVIPAGDSGAVLFADGSKIVPAPGQQIIINNFKPDSNGKMTFTKKLFEVVYQGGAESYQIV
ncbi:MAG TPA: PKD domain-containing protein [Methanoregulaceae archaeon]|nr:PKD domain-containing protein [Methanoregulaceae archaeon]